MMNVEWSWKRTSQPVEDEDEDDDDDEGDDDIISKSPLLESKNDTDIDETDEPTTSNNNTTTTIRQQFFTQLQQSYDSTWVTRVTQATQQIKLSRNKIHTLYACILELSCWNDDDLFTRQIYITWKTWAK